MLAMWQNSIKQDVYAGLPLPQDSGWLHNADGSYTIDWECPEVVRRVQDTIEFLTREEE